MMEEKIPTVSHSDIEEENPGKKAVPEQNRLDISLTTDAIGNKWRPEILWLLIQNTRRFNELKLLLPGITQRALSLQLKDLEKMEFVTREVFKEVPMRVQYTITAKALTLKPVLQAMDNWGKGRVDEGEENISPKKSRASKTEIQPKPEKKTPPPPPSNVLTLF